jgi:hypothetical protein
LSIHTKKKEFTILPLKLFSPAMVHFELLINGTLTDFDCDPDNLTGFCQEILQYASVTYVPTLPGNALYLAIFVVLLVIQITQGIIYRTWGYMICMIFGLVLEGVGYGSRIGMHLNPWDDNPFLA